jgi:AsmA protein
MPFLQKHRKLLLILGSIFAVFLIVLIALPFVIDVNRFRPDIERQLGAALGRKVQIGEVDLALLSGGVKVENVSIADDPAFGADPFLTAGSLDVGVELLPLLFSNAIRIESITLREPQLRLIRGANGTWNFSTIGAAGAQRGKSGNPQPAQSQTQAGQSKENSESAPRELSIGSLNIVDGRVLVSTAPRAKPATYDDVDLEASNISHTSVMPFTLSAKTPGAGSLEVEGKAGPLNPANAAETPLDAKVDLKKMDLSASGFLDPAASLAGTLDFDGTLRSDGKVARTEGKVKAEKLRVVRGGGAAGKPVTFDYATEYDLRRQQGMLTRGDVRTGSALAKLTGNYLTQGNSTVLHMKMNAANAPLSELQALLPAFGVVLPGGSSFQGGTVSANLSVDGPVERLVTTGPLNVSQAKLTGFNLASKMSAISSLTGLKGGGPDTMIETLSSNLRVAPEGLVAEKVNLVLPQIGRLTGNGTVGANNALNFKMSALLSEKAGGLLSGISAIGGQAAKNEIPFLIQGTTSNPVFVPDVAGAVKRRLGSTPGKDPQSLIEGLFGKKKQQ